MALRFVSGAPCIGRPSIVTCSQYSYLLTDDTQMAYSTLRPERLMTEMRRVRTEVAKQSYEQNGNTQY